MPLLDKDFNLETLKRLPVKSLYQLAREIRSSIIQTVTKNGGHLASNLGTVELTIALHRVFDSPVDKIVWDVGHQAYTHKILTGRYKDFPKLRQKGGLSGFPRRVESPHDAFDTGHASTSISAALGILEGKRLQGLPGKAIAVIGDGSMGGGMAQEALSHAGQLGRDLVIVLNDNKMSISPNVGAFPRYLARLSISGRYRRVNDHLSRSILSVPVVGKWLHAGLRRAKRAFKRVFFHRNYFTELGFEYVGPIDGHNINLLLQVFEDVKRANKPVVVHVVTRKGKGFFLAEDNPTAYHGISPLSVHDGKVETKPAVTFTDAFTKALMTVAKADDKVVAITAAMARGTGLQSFQKAYPTRFFDVGIAEEHAVTFAAGLASSGLRPIVALYSTFLQRAYDQVLHDVALQKLPVIFCVDRAGAVSEDGETHQGIYDVSAFSSVPGLTILAPASAAELEIMLRYALSRQEPCLIRYPKALVPQETAPYQTKLARGRGAFISQHEEAQALILSAGGLTANAAAAADELARKNIIVDHYNLRFLKPLDEEYLAGILAKYPLAFVVEDGVTQGGAGEHIRSVAMGRRLKTQIELCGFPEQIYPQMTRSELLAKAGLSASALAQRVAQAIMDKRQFAVVKDEEKQAHA